MADSTGLAADVLADIAAPSRPRRMRLNPSLVIGAVLMLALVLVAAIAPVAWGGAANDLTTHTNLPPSAEHPLGTDGFGRDNLARALVATRLSLIMTLAATALSVVTGIVIGVAIWLSPRRIREAGLRVLEVAVSYPGLLVALVLAAVLGTSAVAVVVAIGLSNIPGFARMSANLAASISHREFVSSARLLGVPSWRIASRHVVPNMAEPILILTASCFAVSLMEISGLSFVGLGVQSPEYDFGKLLKDALPAIYTRPYEVVGPAVMISVTVLAAMLIGDGLAASANPRSRSHVRLARGRLTRRSVGVVAPDAPLVEVRDLHVRAADGVDLVKGIDVTVHRGETVGIVGESGSGKSLTAMAIAQLLPDGLIAEARALRVEEMDLRGRVDPATLATTVGLVYQDPGSTFNPARRLEPQLTEVLRTHRGLSRSQARARIIEALREVRITRPEDRVHQHPYELSGGMRQRAMIASSLAAEPTLLIADEPTTALDVTVQQDILRLLKRIGATRDLATIFISHDLGVVEELCDTVLVMKDGVIVERTTGAALRKGDVHHPYTRRLLDAMPRLEAVTS